MHTAYPFLLHSGQPTNPAGVRYLPGSEIPILFSRFSYYFLIKILILIRVYLETGNMTNSEGFSA